MNNTLNSAIAILEKLVSFDSISGQPTHGIVGYVESYLKEHGIESILSYDADGERANLFATIGPQIDGGVVLNGHTDVVPVEGQDWSSDPFTLTRIDDRLFGRGSVDMKGYLACVLACAPLFKSKALKKPIHIAFSYDEEVGGIGMPALLNNMALLNYQPSIVIVGEPTNMQLINGHKGGYEMRTEITGLAVHSCNPTLGVNAIDIATKLITKMHTIAERFSANPIQHSPFDPPYCTINVGTIEGGTASNATADWCFFKWEFRPMPGENGQLVIDELQTYANEVLLPDMKTVHAGAEIKILNLAPVPALDDSNAELATELVSHITGLNSTQVVSFGTDAGYFSDAGMSTVVFGPGDINRAHKPNEYIEIKELEQGLLFLSKLADHLS